MQIRFPVLHVLGVVMLVLWVAWVAGAGNAVAGTGKAEVKLLSESFEASWPAAPWQVAHPAQAADVDWGRSDHRASAGDHSTWCAGSGTEAPGAGGQVPVNSASWVIAGPFDLSEAESGELGFDLWLVTEEYHDTFMWLASTDGASYSGRARSTNTGGWKRITVDLADWGEAGDLTGQPRVWIAFVYVSDRNGRYEGAYVDNVTLVADSGSDASEGMVFTSKEDFEAGTLTGVEVEDDALQLTDSWSTLPYLWVVNSGTDTVSKVDTASGAELARYRTGPDRELDPGVATVDQDGSCWVGNRAAGTLVKIGLAERHGCVDRNANGAIDTSADDDEDGNISGDELLDWGEDECVLYEVSLKEGDEQTFDPGEEHEAYEDNGIRAVAVDGDNTVWAGVSESMKLYAINAASGLIVDTLDLADSETPLHALVVDSGGMLWAAGWPEDRVLRIDPETEEVVEVELAHGASGLALDGNGHLFVTGYSDRAMSRVKLVDHEVDRSVVTDWQADGIAVTSDGDVWVAAAGGGSLKRYSNDGLLEYNFGLANEPTAVAVDAAGKVWVVGEGNNIIVRVNPATNQRDLEKTLVDSGGHDGGGDMTGTVARNLTTELGTWSVVYDSGAAGTGWGTLWWTATEPDGTHVTVRVRSSDDQVSWSGWEQAASGTALSTAPVGRYLEIEAALVGDGDDGTPVLEELTVRPFGASTEPVAGFTWSPSEVEQGAAVRFTDTTTGEPTAWSWQFGDGSTSDDQNPLHAYAGAGTYSVILSVSNIVGSDSIEQQLTVVSDSCQLDCTASVPDSAVVDQVMTLSGSATPSGCVQEPSFAWQLGDGTSSIEQSLSHSFAEAGTFSWQMTAAADGVSCNKNGDISVVEASQECSWASWVAVATRGAGAYDSNWATDLGLLNPGTELSNVQLRWHGPDGVQTMDLEMAAGSMVDMIDVVDQVSPGSEGSGALQVCSDRELVVTSRTYTRLAGDHACQPGGTFAQYLAGMPAAAGLAAGETGLLPQLRENDRFRTNIGVTNAGSEQSTVRIELFDASGVKLIAYTRRLDPGQWWHDSRPFRNRARRTDLDSAWATVTVTNGGGVLVIASVIDNTTNDGLSVPVVPMP